MGDDENLVAKNRGIRELLKKGIVVLNMTVL
jgi:hypothetical protein